MVLKRWKRKSRFLVYADDWTRLHRDVVITGTGIEKSYCVLGTKGGVGVVPMDVFGDVYLVAQYRYAPDVFSLEIPKGAYESFDCPELPLVAARRELCEETGIQANNWTELAVVNTLMGSSDDRVHLFLATDLTMGKPNPEEGEEIELVKSNLTEVYSLITTGLAVNGRLFAIRDATTIAALALAHNRLIANDKSQS